MKPVHQLMAMTTAVSFFLFSCQKDLETTEVNGALSETTAKAQGRGIAGYVYTLSNQTTGNEVLVYERKADGTLTYANSYATGGTGTGGGLGNQGAVVLSENNKVLLAVNPGSNTVSSFAVSGGGLQLESTVPSGGTTPVSITVYKDIVYVLNAGGIGNISGFWLQQDGSLSPIAHSTRPLSAANAGPAQISFIADGSAVVITEKATNTITTYTINKEGIPSVMHTLAAANQTPFGFAAGKKGIIYVSEAVGGAPGASTVSSYHINSNGVISLIEGPVSAGQTAACWVVVTNNGKYVYATNTGSNNISSFQTDNSGSLDVLDAVAASTGTGSVPIDAALSNNSKFLYELNSGNESIGVYSIEHKGNLDPIQYVTGLPDGATGLAAQ
jgi:6-phosphogluconolactonase